MKSTLCLLKNQFSKKSIIQNSFKNLATKERKINPFCADKVIESYPTPNKDRLKGKFAVVTGGTGGIGSETADLLIANGASGVTVTDLDSKKGNLLVEQLNDKHKSKVARFVAADISNEEQVKRLYVEHMQHFGKLNVMVNNAGIMHDDDSDPVKTPVDIWRKTLDINTFSVFLCCKYGIPYMLNSRTFSSIINISSMVAKVGSANAQIAYTASKGAVLSMTKEVGIIYARENIRANAVCPGPLYTELLKNWLNTDEKLDRRLAHLPYGRFGHPREIAQAIVFLASDESSLVNASEFMVDGGLTAAYLTPL